MGLTGWHAWQEALTMPLTSTADLQRSCDAASGIGGIRSGKMADDACAFWCADTTEGDRARTAGFGRRQSQAAGEDAGSSVELHHHAPDFRTGGGCHAAALHGECDFRLGWHVFTDQIELRCPDAFLEAEQVKPRRLGCVAGADHTGILHKRDAVGEGTAIGRRLIPREFACGVANGIDEDLPSKRAGTARVGKDEIDGKRRTKGRFRKRGREAHWCTAIRSPDRERHIADG